MVKRPGTLIVFLLVVLIFLMYLTPKVLQVRELEARSRHLEEELRQIRHENRVLEYELRLLREDPVYLEKVAREKFNRAKQGEIVYKVVREGEE